jgi:hypothetical protein
VKANRLLCKQGLVYSCVGVMDPYFAASKNETSVVHVVSAAVLRALRQTAWLLLVDGSAAGNVSARKVMDRITGAFAHDAKDFPVEKDIDAAGKVLTACGDDRVVAARVVLQATRQRVGFLISQQPVSKEHSVLKKWHNTLRFVPFTSGVTDAVSAREAAAAFEKFAMTHGTLHMLRCPVCQNSRPPTEMVKAVCGHYVCMASEDGVESCLHSLLSGTGICPECRLHWERDVPGKPRSLALQTVVTSTADLTVISGDDPARIIASLKSYTCRMRKVNGNDEGGDVTYGGALNSVSRNEMVRRCKDVAGALQAAYEFPYSASTPMGKRAAELKQKLSAIAQDIDKVSNDVAQAAFRIEAMANEKAPLQDFTNDLKVVESGIDFLRLKAVRNMQAVQVEFDQTVGVVARA